MDITCSIIEDILPIYVEKLCSDDTIKLVEEHLENCSHCQALHQRMTSVELHEDMKQESQIKTKPLNAKKVIKKIRRRWLALLLCILLLIPIGTLTFNQVRGSGLSYTAIPKVLECNAFLSALKHKDYNKAFTYIDVEEVFNDHASIIYADVSQHPLAEYNQAEIGGFTYYVNEEVYNNTYRFYLEDGDEFEFWYSLLNTNENRHNTWWAFPERFMSQFQEQIKMDDSDHLKCFLEDFELVEGENASYYVDGNYADLMSLDECFGVDSLEIDKDIYPEYYYNLKMERMEEIISQQNAYSNQYIELGLDKYTELSKSTFESNLNSFTSKGYALTGYRLNDVDIIREEGGGISYQITYDLSVTRDGVTVTTSDFYICITCDNDGIRHALYAYKDRPDLPYLLRLYHIPYQE